MKIALRYQVRSRIDYRPVFVLCSPRTGSNLLINYLNSIPGVFLAGEIISPWQVQGLRKVGISKHAVFRHLRHSMNYRNRQVSGAKIFFSHLKERRITLGNMKNEFPEARWIILYRKDTVAQYISYERSRRTLEYRKGSFYLNKQESFEAFDFDSQEATRFCQEIQNDYQHAANSESIGEENSLWVSYEELDHNAQELFDNRIFPFLKIKRCAVSTVLKKQRSSSYADTIRNMQTLYEFMAQHKCKAAYFYTNK